jgi:hypothetical protein
MPTLFATNRVTPPKAHFVIALATDVLHLWACRTVASLDAV